MFILCLSGEEGKSELVNSSMGEEEQESLLMDVGGLGVEAAALSKGVESRAVAEGASDGPSVVASGNDDDVEQKRSEACVGVVTAVLEDPGWVQHLRAICVILGGEKTIALHQEFLIRNNNSDLQILKNTKVRLYYVYFLLLADYLSCCLFFLFLSAFSVSVFSPVSCYGYNNLITHLIMYEICIRLLDPFVLMQYTV